MQPQLPQGFEAIEKQRRSIQSRVCALTDAQISSRPSAGAWSIGEIVEHLVLSDETLGQVQEAAEPEALMFRILPRALRRALVLSAFRRDAVLPLPSPGVEPAGGVPLPLLWERWEASRLEMRRALETLRGGERPYAHPVLGPLTAGEMLTLAEVHTAYHTRQMERAYPASLLSDPPAAER